jgi:hypothetical protein
MLRALFVALASYVLMECSAMACPGQAGKVIFEDSFTDDSGGWLLDPPNAEIKNGAFLLRPNAGGAEEKVIAFKNTTSTFSAVEADYCAEFIIPNSLAADNPVIFGLVFFESEKGRYYVWLAFSNGTVALLRRNNDKWDNIFVQAKSQASLKFEPNALNTIRVIAKDNKLTLFINDVQIKMLRAQFPAGELRFGVYAEVGKATNLNPLIQVKSFKVTQGK